MAMGQLPRRIWRYGPGGSAGDQLWLSPRQEYIARQSIVRWERRTGEKFSLSQAIIGQFDGIKIIRDAR